jgi:lipoate-protein ligase A
VKLYEFDTLPGVQSMTTFHTLAREGIEAFSMVSPQTPIISVGYFQDAAAEIDINYCAANDLPVFRREIGGGGVYLDANQIFYHVILHRDNPLASRRISELYKTLSAPAIETYRELEIETQFRPVNDIVTVDGQRKIAGEGAGDIGPCVVFVGSIMLDFDYDTMARVINVPDEKFRDKIHKSIKEHVTTVYKETGKRPTRAQVREILKRKFAAILGEFEPAQLTPELIAKRDEVTARMMDEAFLYKRTMKKPGALTIRSGVEFIMGMHKAPGGLIRTASEVKGNVIEDVAISGDFTLLPLQGLPVIEDGIKGAERTRGEIGARIDRVVAEEGLQIPGVSVEDMLLALKIEK